MTNNCVNFFLKLKPRIILIALNNFHTQNFICSFSQFLPKIKLNPLFGFFRIVENNFILEHNLSN